MVALKDDWQFASVKEIARSLGIADAKVLAWISSGELAASNIATSTTTRPIWRISRAAFDAFWAARSVAPVVTPARRQSKRSASTVKSYV